MIILRNKLQLAIALVALFFAALFLTGIFGPSSSAERLAKQSLESLGFDTSLFPHAVEGWGKAYFNNIALDKDGFSTIQSIDIRYNPVTFPFTGKLDSVTLEGLNLTGEWDPAAKQKLTFSGFSVPEEISPLAKIPARRIKIAKAGISVLTPGLGGISVTFDGEGVIRKKKKLEFQAHIESGQKYISFSANADGVIAKHYANLDIQIDEGKFEVPEAEIKTTRINGAFNATLDNDMNLKILGELQAGGMNVIGTPWQNASATFDISNGTMQIFSEGKSTGVEGIELNINMQKQGAGPLFTSGSIHADSGADLAAYLGGQVKVSPPAPDLDIIRGATDVKIDFALAAAREGRKIRYRIGGENVADTSIREMPVQ